MNSDNGDGMKTRVSRRRVLEGGACAFGAALLGATAASAEEDDSVVIPKKASQAKVGYRDATDWRRCSTCRHYRPPESCRVVEGPIRPDGRSKLWARRWGKPAVAV